MEGRLRLRIVRMLPFARTIKLSQERGGAGDYVWGGAVLKGLQDMASIVTGLWLTHSLYYFWRVRVLH
jgi:hypothetical protein